MERDENWKDWVYEDVHEEDNRKMGDEDFEKLEAARRNEDVRMAEDRKRD